MSIGEDVATILPNPAIHISFQDEEKIAGFDGCNNIMGTYSLDDQILKIGPIMSTMMACSGDQTTTNLVHKALNVVNSYRITLKSMELR